jgi:hypothetical protein
VSLTRLLLKSKSQRKRLAQQGTEAIDVIIPAIPVDLPVLPYVINGLRKNLLHPIGRILVISPDSSEIKEFCDSYRCDFVDESRVLPFGVNDINLKINGLNRSGWIFQQLLKLNADTLSKKKHCLVIDADTILTRPQAFITKGKEVINCSDEFHKPYFTIYQKITGEQNLFPLSFVTHHMLLSLEKLRALKNKIELHAKQPWYNAILQNLDKTEFSSFSEYETYGNFVRTNYPHEIETCYWFNKSIHRNQLPDLDHLIAKYSFLYKSISIHSYYKN